MLPKYRGSAPIQWAVLNGDKITGVTTMYLDVGMDDGDMILQEQVEIKNNETSGELWDRLGDIGADLLVETIEKIENNTAPRIKQSDDYTMAPMLQKEMGNINWEELSTEQINNLVRGLNPIIGAYSYLSDKKIKIWRTELLTNEQIKELDISIDNTKPGTVLVASDKLGLYVKTKDGVIKLLEIQAENSKKMRAQDFLRGNKIDVGSEFVNI